MTLSVITICQDEETTIRWFLECCVVLKEKLKESLTEIVIVDGGSIDTTIAVIEEFRDKLPLIVFTYPFDTWGKQRNRALEKCTGDLIFSPDADMTWTNNLGDCVKGGKFNLSDFWNLQVRFTVQDRHHFSSADGVGGSLRIWKRGPVFITDFHERLHHQPVSPPVMPDVHIFENSLLLTDEQLLNRGKRLQKYAVELKANGNGPGPEDRYVDAKRTALQHALQLPDNLIGML